MKLEALVHLSKQSYRRTHPGYPQEREEENIFIVTITIVMIDVYVFSIKRLDEAAI